MQTRWSVRTALVLGCVAICAVVAVCQPARAQNVAVFAADADETKTDQADEGAKKDAADPAPAAEGGLATEQEQVAAKFRDLERLLLRMAELTAPTDPRRAALLRRAVAQAKQRDIDHQFEELVALLKQERLASVVKNQGELQQDLGKLLDLLLSEDRSKRIESEKERIRDYLKRVNRIIKEQKGIQGETARGGDAGKLADQQGELSEKTGKLAKELEEDTGKKQPAGDEGDEDKDDKKPGDKKQDGQKEGDQPSDADKSKPSDQDSADGKSGKPGDDQKDGEKKDAGDKKEKDKSDADKKDAEKKNGDKKEGGKDARKQEGEKQDGADKPGTPQDGAQGEQQPSEGTPSDGQSQQNESPAQKRLDQAERRMKEAQQKLEEAKRNEAKEKQAEAIKELEQARADLEEILRQLREEEMSRTLAMLETRFRKMLEQQIEVYEGTKRLDKVAEAERDRDDEIEAGRLSRKEAQISTEADKALAVLREEGSAVAFPEAVAEMRVDMDQIVGRLAQAKVGELTQGIEKDVIAALEEMIASLQKAQKDLENKQKQGQQQQASEDQEPPLVDTLSELKMIRALQMRVNTRTKRYAALAKDEQAEAPELLKALKDLAEREQRIHKVTRDIVVGRNR